MVDKVSSSCMMFDTLKIADTSCHSLAALSAVAFLVETTLITARLQMMKTAPQ